MIIGYLKQLVTYHGQQVKCLNYHVIVYVKHNEYASKKVAQVYSLIKKTSTTSRFLVKLIRKFDEFKGIIKGILIQVRNLRC